MQYIRSILLFSNSNRGELKRKNKMNTHNFCNIAKLVAVSTAFAMGCLVTNQNHCGLNQGACGEGQMCSVCEVDNNGCVDNDVVLDSGCKYNDSSSSSSSNDSTNISNNSSSSDDSNSSSDSTSSNSTSFDSSDSTSSNSEGLDSSSNENSSSSGIVEYCGDGIISDKEECDDANDDDSDFCLSNCLNIKCGDGIVNGDENCDDANKDDLDNCNNLCLESRFIFVSSKTVKGYMYNENPNNKVPKIGIFTGIELANAQCQKFADDSANEMLSGKHFEALISGNIHNEYKGYYKNVKQDLLGFGFVNLFDSIFTEISYNELGMVNENNFVWTGLIGPNVFDESSSCANIDEPMNINKWWTAGESDQYGGIGNSEKINPQWFNYSMIPCDSEFSLYCIEVEAEK